MAILISGRGSNMNAILSSHAQSELRNIHPCVVISNKKDAPGLKIAREKFHIPTEVLLGHGKKGWEYDKEIISVLKNYEIFPSNGIICLAGYMRILSKEFVRRYKFRILNVHPSLLPSFKGLNAQKQAFDYGVKISGCTVHFIDDDVDTGPIIIQESIPIYENDTEEDLSNRILKIEHKLYPLALKLFSDGKLQLDGRKVHLLEK
ncbi:MAG TPA: phosphoribosylglycinamide formyltransferase [Nitrososphaeraceae archaeon]|nr:phosphoribosylglycinamide formyltransferase [Nitrososphaeraceae archaeon]